MYVLVSGCVSDVYHHAVSPCGVSGAPGGGGDRSVVPGSVSVPGVVSRGCGTGDHVTIRRTILQRLYRFTLRIIIELPNELLKHTD